MKKSEVEAMFIAMQQISGLKTTAKFAYGIARNKGIINNEAEAIKEMEKPIGEFEKERIALCKKYAEKDEKGTLLKEIDEKTGQEVFKGLNDNEAFTTKLTALREKYNPRFDEINKILKEDIEFSFYMINLSEVPDDITPRQMTALMPLIKED